MARALSPAASTALHGARLVGWLRGWLRVDGGSVCVCLKGRAARATDGRPSDPPGRPTGRLDRGPSSELRLCCDEACSRLRSRRGAFARAAGALQVWARRPLMEGCRFGSSRFNRGGADPKRLLFSPPEAEAVVAEEQLCSTRRSLGAVGQERVNELHAGWEVERARVDDGLGGGAYARRVFVLGLPDPWCRRPPPPPPRRTWDRLPPSGALGWRVG